MRSYPLFLAIVVGVPRPDHWLTRKLKMSNEWKLLPTKPTAEMGIAGLKAANGTIDAIDLHGIYTAMVEVAPERPRAKLLTIASRQAPIAVTASQSGTEAEKCWNCRQPVSLEDRESEWLCPHCNIELCPER